MNYKVNWSIADGAFAVPDCVADNYIKLASGKAVKVLIYIMRHKTADDENAADIAEKIDKHMTAEDVEDAFSYWEQVGVICRAENTARNTAQTNFTDEKSISENNTPATQSISAVSSQRSLERSAKMLSPKEIAERINQSDEIAFLFKSTEEILGKVLTYTDQRTLIWLHDFHSMGSDLILMIIDYCKSINKPGISYIEKVAETWIEKDISTHEQAEAEIRRMQSAHSLERQVVSRLGLNRSLTSKEREYVEAWDKSGITIELIEYAYEKTVNATGKAAFGYMNKILNDWNLNNLHTIPEIDSYNARYAQNKNNSVKKVQTASSSEEHSYDLNRLLEHAMNNVPTIKED